MIFPMKWYLLFLVSIPQVYFGLLLGLAVFNLELKWHKTLIISIIGGCIGFLIRLFPMVLGVPSVIDVLVLSLLLLIIGKIRFSHALCATMAAMMIAAIVECCILPICLNISGLTFQQLQDHQFLMFLFFIPEVFLLLFLYYFIRRTNFKMWDLNKLEIGQD